MQTITNNEDTTATRNYDMDDRRKAGTKVGITELCALLAITALGAYLRFWTLDDKSLYGDEMNMVRFVTGERDLEKNFGNAHLYLLIMGFFRQFGTSDFIMRLPAALAGVATIPLIHHVGKKLIGWRVGLSAALILAISPVHIDLSQMVHSYTLFPFLSLLSFYFLWQAYHRSSLKYWVGFALATGINMNIHLFTIFVLGSEIAILFILAAYKRWPWSAKTWAQAIRQCRWQRGLVVFGIIFLFSMPVVVDSIVPFLGELSKKVAGNETEVAQFNRKPRFTWSVPTFARASRELVIWQSRDTWMSWTCYLLSVTGLVSLYASRRSLALSLAAWLFVPLFPATVFTYVTVMDLGVRRFSFLLPILFLAMGAGLICIGDLLDRVFPKRSNGRRSVAIGGGLVVAFSAVFSATAVKDYFYHYERPDFKLAAYLISRFAEPEDLVVSWKPAQLYYYLPKSVEVISVPPRHVERIIARFAEKQRIWYLRPGAIRHNPQFAEMEAWLKEIGAFLLPLGGGIYLSIGQHEPVKKGSPGDYRLEVVDEAIGMRPGRWYLHAARGRVFQARRELDAMDRELALSEKLMSR